MGCQTSLGYLLRRPIGAVQYYPLQGAARSQPTEPQTPWIGQCPPHVQFVTESR